MERYIRVFLLGIIVMLGLASNAFAIEVAEALQYPFSNGTQTQYDNFGLNQGFNHWNAKWSGYHIGHDVAAPTGTKVYASADGTVIESQNHPHGGYGSACGANGYIVLIESQFGDGTIFTIIYGHVRSGTYNESGGTGLVPEGTIVHRGQYIATVADYPADGDDENSACDDANWDHLHFGVRIGAYNSTESIRGYGSSAGVWTNPRTFVEDNEINCSTYTAEYDAIKNQYGSFIGNEDGNPYNYDGICAQDYDDSGTSDGTSAILFDSAGGARQAYLVRSGFWNHYNNVCGGPDGWCWSPTGNVQCGAPINDEYYNGINIDNGYGTARQDFQGCYLYWDGSVATAKAYPAAAPGEFEGGAFNSISYAFAEAYEHNGSRNSMGEAVAQFGNQAGVHHWGDNASLPYVQDFTGGNYGWSILMYNEELDEAFAIHTNFWETYRDNGPGTYGAACTDEYVGNDGYTYQEFESYLFRWTGHRTLVYDKGYDHCSIATITSVSAGLTAVNAYTSQVPTNLAAVDLADLSSSVTCAVDEPDSLYVVLNGQDNRIYELETTNDGTTWSSSHLTSLAAVPYSADGTSPHLFIDPTTSDRYVTFMGNNARINLFHYNGTSWSAVELTSVVAAPLGDITTSPFGYIANGVVYVVFQGNDQRIWRFSVTNGTSYGSLDLTGQAAVAYAMPGTSPMAVYNDLTGEHHILFQGINQRIQRLTYNGSTWSSVEITSVVNSDLLDPMSQPFSYVDPFTGYDYTVINGVNERIDWIADYNTSWSSAELTSIVAVPLTEPGSSPTGYIDPFTGHHVITFQGDNGRINQFEGTPWTSIDLTSQAAVTYAAPGTSPGTCVDPSSGVRHLVFVGENGRIQYIRLGPP